MTECRRRIRTSKRSRGLGTERTPSCPTATESRSLLLSTKSTHPCLSSERTSSPTSSQPRRRCALLLKHILLLHPIPLRLPHRPRTIPKPLAILTLGLINQLLFMQCILSFPCRCSCLISHNSQFILTNILPPYQIRLSSCRTINT